MKPLTAEDFRKGVVMIRKLADHVSNSGMAIKYHVSDFDIKARRSTSQYGTRWIVKGRGWKFELDIHLSSGPILLCQRGSDSDIDQVFTLMRLSLP